jgi:IS30 family transposase
MKLSKTAINAIKENGELFGKIADQLNRSPFTLINKVRRNDVDLTQAAIIRLIKQYTILSEDEILTDDTVMDKIII